MTRDVASSNLAERSILRVLPTPMLWDLDGRRIYDTERGYQLVYLPDHPQSNNGTILLHRVIMENVLDRQLLPGEVVHHKNEIKNDNRPDNLELKTNIEHSRQHALERAKDSPGETYITLVCARCGERFLRVFRNRHEESAHRFCSRACSVLFYKPRKGVEDCLHGTYARYRRGCRCDDCRAANTARCRRFREGAAEQ